MPLDLGAKGSCQIGGNLATNAGGIKFIKYNSMHANCLGLKAVLADGTVLDNMNPHKKDSTGYDLKHLFIGSEGTLGFITECAILCPPMAKNRQICLLGGNNYDDVLKCLQVAKKNLSDSLTAIEFMDWSSASLAIDYQGQENPFDDIYEFYLLIEIAGNQSSEDLSMTMIDLLEEMDGHFEDGIVCENEQ
jgi:D-2-hydroxyglutarate dehydrogenase